MVDLKTIDDFMSTALLALPVVLFGIGAVTSAIEKIIERRERGDNYILMDKRLTGTKEIRIYYRPLNYIRLPIQTSYKEPGETL